MSLQSLTERFKRKPNDVVGIDFGRTGSKLVRLRRTNDDISIVGLEMLPAVDISGASGSVPAFSIPSKLKARYVAVAVGGANVTARLLTFPGTVDSSFGDKLAKNMGLPEEADDRMSYRIVTEGQGRQESRVLAAALPESQAETCMKLFGTGLPAPISLEVASLSTLTAFEAGPVTHSKEPAIGLIDFSTRFSTLSIFYKKKLVLLRRFDFGVEKLFERITASLNVDAETALNILSDNAFDISEMITDIISPFSSQLIVSRDYVERRENCSLKQLHLIGGIAASNAAVKEMERSMNLAVETWNPFTIPSISTDPTLAKNDDLYQGQEWRFAAALGAALGALQESS